jgi:phosphoribosylanthranilate isomerase
LAAALPLLEFRPVSPAAFLAPHRTSLKICGVTLATDAERLAELGVDALGANFWPKSKRYLAPALAAEWVDELKPLTTLVAVLVNPTPDQLQQALPLVHVLQLHGDESPEECARVMTLGLPVIKALQVRDRESLSMIGDYPCHTILLDAYCPGLYGGEGKTFPWELAIEAKQRFSEKHFILAGGLVADNVAEAVAQVKPVAVDVASGVESSPGIKDLALVQRFIEQAQYTACR